MQLLSHRHQGKIESGTSREYGFCEVEILENQGLFTGFQKGEKVPVWMSHGDSVGEVPKEGKITAKERALPGRCDADG